jgi:hypothetical protein
MEDAPLDDVPAWRVVKKDKRLYVMDGDRVVYTPPDFLRSRVNRDSMAVLASQLEAGGGINAIIEYETKLRPA